MRTASHQARVWEEEEVTRGQVWRLEWIRNHLEAKFVQFCHSNSWFVRGHGLGERALFFLRANLDHLCLSSSFKCCITVSCNCFTFLQMVNQNNSLGIIKNSDHHLTSPWNDLCFRWHAFTIHCLDCYLHSAGPTVVSIVMNWHKKLQRLASKHQQTLRWNIPPHAFWSTNVASITYKAFSCAIFYAGCYEYIQLRCLQSLIF